MTEQITSCPIEAGGRQTVRHSDVPLEQVERIFGDCSGYYELPHKKPIEESKVVTRFNREQYPFVIAVSAYLNALLAGKVYRKSPGAIVSFSQKVVENFDPARTENGGFAIAVVDSWDQTMRDFIKIYPNLYPALYQIYRLSGLELGVGAAIERSLFAVNEHQSVNGKQNFAISKHGLAQGAIDAPWGTEIQCTGLAAIVTSTRETQKAALQLLERYGDQVNCITSFERISLCRNEIRRSFYQLFNGQSS